MPCCIRHATDSSSKCRLFRFPTDAARRQLWTLNCRRILPNFVPMDCHRLCEKHFDEAQFESHRADGLPKLRPDAVPLLFVDKPVTAPSRKRHRSIIHVTDEHLYSKKTCENVSVAENRPTNRQPTIPELPVDGSLGAGNGTDDESSQQTIRRLQLEIRKLKWQLQQSKKREDVLTANIAKFINAVEKEKLKQSLEDEDYTDQLEDESEDRVIDASAIQQTRSTDNGEPNSQQPAEQSSEFHVIDGGTAKGGQVLVDGRGYRYVVNIRRGERTYWRCCTRSREHSLCYATAVQSATGFSLGQQQHTHPPPPDVYVIATALRDIRKQAVENVSEPASNIVNRVLAAIGTDVPLPNAKNLARAATYHRRRQCPTDADTQDMELILGCE